MSGIFATQAPLYRAMGLWPRPVTAGSKACYLPQWQKSDPEIGEEGLQRMLQENAACGIGLVMGSPLPNGTTLGALDIDRDDYVRLGKALLGGHPPCGRFGSKGAVFFVRVRPGAKNRKFRVGGKDGEQIAEALFFKSLCVIPPTIHPDTEQAYQWLGTPLLEVDISTLPLIGE